MVSIKREDAVSEILGTILLLSIVVGIFGLIYVNVFGYEFNEMKPTTTLVTSIEEDLLVVEHIGGNPISADSRIFIDIDGVQTNYSLNSLMDAQDVSDNLLSIGEKVIYHAPSSLVANKVQTFIIDERSEFMYSTGVIIP